MDLCALSNVGIFFMNLATPVSLDAALFSIESFVGPSIWTSKPLHFQRAGLIHESVNLVSSMSFINIRTLGD